MKLSSLSFLLASLGSALSADLSYQVSVFFVLSLSTIDCWAVSNNIQYLFLFPSCIHFYNPFLFFQPEVLSSENGLLEVTLTVDMVESLNGIEWSETGTRLAPGYNGLPVGPTLRVRPGDTMKVTLRNNLPPGSDLDKELYAYVRDAESDENNVTAIVNRISPLGAYVST
jgi:FtsP/CotA-like multicopper oxidase with cupredoxin domain